MDKSVKLAKAGVALTSLAIFLPLALGIVISVGALSGSSVLLTLGFSGWVLSVLLGVAIGFIVFIIGIISIVYEKNQTKRILFIIGIIVFICSFVTWCITIREWRKSQKLQEATE